MTGSAPSELLRDPHLQPLKEWIIRRTGLSYYKDREDELARALEQVFGSGQEPLPAAGKILSRLQSNASELDALVEQLTIGETFFFRHMEMFHALRDSVFPDLLKRRSASRCLRIWSAGCSIGAEPYSIAILLREMLGAEFKDWAIHILGTDINRKFLRIAEAGAYDPWTLRGMPPHVLHRCFTKEGSKWRLTERCRAGVSFRSHNLASDPLPDAASDLACFDLIICRNVMIYFDQPSIQRLAGQFYDALTPGGWLAVGHAEPHTGTFRMFRTVNATGAVLYQRQAKEEPLLKDVLDLSPANIRPVGEELPYRSPSRLPVLPSPPSRHKPKPVELLPARPAPMAPPAGSPAPAAEDPLAGIIRLADEGDLMKAFQACDAHILKEPLCAGAHYYHGMILYQFCEWAAAEKSLRRCLYLARDLSLAHFYLGLVQERLGRSPHKHFANALDLLAKLPQEHPVPLGQGLTVREFRSLLTAPEHLKVAAAMKP